MFLYGFIFQSESQCISALCVALMSHNGICSIFQMSPVKRQVCLRLFLQITKVLIYKIRYQKLSREKLFPFI